MNGTFQNCSCSAACALGAGPCCDEKSMMAARAEAASLRADPARACGSADNDHALADATSKRDMQTLKSTLALAAKLINGLPVRREVCLCGTVCSAKFPRTLRTLYVGTSIMRTSYSAPEVAPRPRFTSFGCHRLVPPALETLYLHCVSSAGLFD